MTATQKIKNMIEQKSVEQIGAAGWMHTPECDRTSPEEFADRVIGMTDVHGWDFIKLMSNGYYLDEAFGMKLHFYSTAIPLQYQKTKHLADFEDDLIHDVKELGAFAGIGETSESIAQNPVIQFNSKAIRLLANHYKGTVPIIATVFAPSMVLTDLVGGNDKLLSYMENNPKEVHHALTVINKSLIGIVKEFINAGADGFFLATKHTSPDTISKEQYYEFCKPYDLALLEEIGKGTWFNILHVHGQKDMFMEEYVNYPVQAINWENIPHGLVGQGVTTVADLRKITDKILIGGTDQFFDFYGSLEEIQKRFKLRVETAAAQSGDLRFIFAPGCSLPLDISDEKLHVLRTAADEWNSSFLRNKKALK